METFANRSVTITCGHLSPDARSPRGTWRDSAVVLATSVIRTSHCTSALAARRGTSTSTHGQWHAYQYGRLFCTHGACPEDGRTVWGRLTRWRQRPCIAAPRRSPLFPRYPQLVHTVDQSPTNGQRHPQDMMNCLNHLHTCGRYSGVLDHDGAAARGSSRGRRDTLVSLAT